MTTTNPPRNCLFYQDRVDRSMRKPALDDDPEIDAIVSIENAEEAALLEELEGPLCP